MSDDESRCGATPPTIARKRWDIELRHVLNQTTLRNANRSSLVILHPSTSPLQSSWVSSGTAATVRAPSEGETYLVSKHRWTNYVWMVMLTITGSLFLARRLEAAGPAPRRSCFCSRPTVRSIFCSRVSSRRLSVRFLDSVHPPSSRARESRLRRECRRI